MLFHGKNHADKIKTGTLSFLTSRAANRSRLFLPATGVRFEETGHGNRRQNRNNRDDKE